MFEPGGGAQCTACEGFAALGAMDQFEPFALATKDNRMITNRVTRSQRHHADRFMWSNAGNSLAAENRVRLEFELASFGDCTSQGKGSTARRIDLGAMMNFEHLGIKTAQYGG